MGTFWPSNGRASTFTTNGFSFGDGTNFPENTNQFYVTKTGNDTNGDGSIVKPFLTIQKAVSSVVGNTVINIAPGTYIEDITFVTAGVSVLLNGQEKQTVYITGTIDISVGCYVTLEDMSVYNSVASVVIFAGALNQSLDMRNVHLMTQAGNTQPCLLASNTGGSSINCFNTQIQVNDSTGGSKAIVQTGDTNFNLFNCNASINDNNDNIALDFSGTGGGYSHQFGSIGGQSVLSGGVSFNISILGVITNTVPCIISNTAGFVLIGTASFITTANPCVTGSGSFNYLLVGKLFGAGIFAPTLNGGLGAQPLPMDGANNVMYDNTVSNLTATNVKTAIDELALKSGVLIDVTQVGHTFTLGQAVYQDSAGVWQLAIADINLPKQAAQGIVTNVAVNTFTVVREGRITVTAHGLAPSGDYFYLSQTVAGSLTATQPTTGLQVLIGKIVDANTLDVGPIITSLSTAFNPAGSYVRRSGGLTQGSVNTNVVIYATAQESNGTDITYVNSATNGDKFVVNSNGVYAISVSTHADTSQYCEIDVGTLQNNSGSVDFRNAINVGVGEYGGTAWTGPITAGQEIYIIAMPATFSFGFANQITIVRLA